MTARCRACGAFRPTAVCPVCQQFDPPLGRSAVAGAALLGLVAAGLAVGGWAGVLWWKWDRWQRLFGRTGEPPEAADATSAAALVGFLVAATVWVAATAVVARSARTE